VVRHGARAVGGSSSVDVLTVGGTPVSIVGGRTLDLSLLGVRIRTNQLVGDTRQALILDVAGAQVVLGEATASGDACVSAAVGGQSGSGTRSDVLSGSEGADRLHGAAGNDHLDGGTGRDTL
jgi:Ca2+-binding RTX toxin-like protein